MKIRFFRFSHLIFFTAVLLALGSYAYADDTAQRSQMEAQLGLDPRADTYPHATSYYDDKVDHYEQEQITFDQINEGIR